ncbi:hypothetical protein [Microbacterium oxydans]|nr:hypothetical protein [Microbacterium oxydans]
MNHVRPEGGGHMDGSVSDSSQARRIYGPPRAAVLAFGAPEPAIAYAVPFAGVVIVVATILMTVFAGDLVFANSEVAALRGGPGVLGGVAILAVAMAIAHGFGITAATLAVIARVDGRRLAARSAWAGAARRPGSVLLATLVTLVIVAVVVGIVAVLMPVLPIAGIAAAIALLPIGIVLAPLLLAWPLIVAGTHSLPAALAAAWRSPRAFQGQAAEPLGSPRFAVSVTVVLTGLISVGLGWLGGLLPAGWWTPVVGVALALVPAALTQLLLVAVAVRGMALRVKGPLQPTSTDSTSTDSTSAVGSRRGGVLAGLAVLLVPAVVAGALIAVNPWSVPAYAAADVSRVWNSSEIVQWDGGTAVLSRLGGEDSRALLCDGATCGPGHDMRSILPTTIAPAADGGILSASWYPIEGADATKGSFELRVTHSTPDALAHWSDPADEEASEAEVSEKWRGFPGEERVLGSVDSTFRAAESVFARSQQSRMAVAIDSSGPTPVIASIVRPTARDSILSVDFCDDAECTSSRRTSLPVQWSLWSTNSTSLDIASASDGDAAVITLVDDVEEDGAVPLRVMTATADGDWTTEALDADVPGESVTDLDTSHGAQLAMNADGLPVILFRGSEQRDMRLFTCENVSCSSADFTDITPDTELVHTPALAIDASGRPLIGTIDRAVNIAILSCDDATCTSRTSVPLSGVVATDTGFTDSFALSLDDQEHPLIAVGLRRSGATSKDTASGTILECTAARCGAD